MVLEIFSVFFFSFLVSNCELIDCDIGVTYEQMQAIIEGALIESGYYHMPSLGTQFSSTPTRMNSSSRIPNTTTESHTN